MEDRGSTNVVYGPTYSQRLVLDLYQAAQHSRPASCPARTRRDKSYAARLPDLARFEECEISR